LRGARSHRDEPNVTSPIIQIESGRLRGATRGGITRFLGVPYAASPTGVRRFAAPEPYPPWVGIRDALLPGPNAPQVRRPFANLDITPLIGAGWRQGDEFLTVNIWTPDPGARGLPVMVFIHGGAWVAGDKDAAVHDGSAFARAGLVCITINYRLAVEGFLPIPGAVTNLGLRDQIAALMWVQSNAAAFGGDPANVTVFGESAGAMCIANLITSPLASGLYHRAIIQSGHGSMVRSMPIAGRLVTEVARRLGVAADVEGFRSCSIERCLAVVDEISQPGVRIDLREWSGSDPSFGLTRFLPVFGDDVLPEAPVAALARGAGTRCDLLIGTNREEMNLYFVPSGFKRALTFEQAGAVLQAAEPNALKILEAYREVHASASAGEVFTTAMTDLVFRWPARRFAALHRGRTHGYEFGWRSPAFEGELGACHALELPFVFNTLASCSAVDGLVGLMPPQAIADRVHRLWIAFATDGSLPWPVYDEQSRQHFALERAETVIDSDIPAAHVALRHNQPTKLAR
jgi:para-nitrobenzyl esterase